LHNGSEFPMYTEKLGKVTLFCSLWAGLNYFYSMKYTEVNKSFIFGPKVQLISYQFGQLKLLVFYDAECLDLPNFVKQDSFPINEDIIKNKKALLLNPNLSYTFYGDDKEKFMPIHYFDDTNSDCHGYSLLDYARFYFTGSDELLLCKWSDIKNTPILRSASDMANLMESEKFFATLSKTHDCLTKISNIVKIKPEGATTVFVCKQDCAKIDVYDAKPNAFGIISHDLGEYLRSGIDILQQRYTCTLL
jgi:hypothetical protein